MYQIRTREIGPKPRLFRRDRPPALSHTVTDALRSRKSTAYNQDSEVGCHSRACRGGASGLLCFPASVAARAAGLARQDTLMTLDEAVALSLIPELSRVGLTERLRADDPVLLEIARTLSRRSASRAAARGSGGDPACWRGTIRGFPSRCSPSPTCRRRSGIAARSTRCERPPSPSSARAPRRPSRSKPRSGSAPTSPRAASPSSAAWRAASIRPRIAARSRRAGRSPCSDRASIASIRAEHATLAADIARDGLVVSEYPPRHAAAPVSLPDAQPAHQRAVARGRRDRGEREVGSLITAACALEQGRDVMAVPGNVLSGRNRGAHALIRDGAKIVECADDIVEELGCARCVDRHQRMTGQVAVPQALPGIRCCK